MMLSLNNDLHWTPEDKDGAVAVGQLVEVNNKVTKKKTYLDLFKKGQWRWLVTAIDWLIALTLLSPLCIFYWRGTWQLLDIYLDMEDVYVTHPGGYVSLAIGYLLTFLCNVTQRLVTDVITNQRRNVLLRCLLSRIYTLLFAFGLVNLWRGVWQLLDAYFTNSWLSGAGSAVAGCWALASLRTLRNIAAPPVVINTDIMDSDYACSPTMFQSLCVKKSWWFFLLDVAFSVLVVGSLVVFVWRGIWTVMDRLLLPHSADLSCWASLAIGYAIVLLSYFLQRPFASTSRRFASNFTRILFEDLFYLFASFGAISVWRGVWLFADVYIYPEDREFSNWLTMMVGMLGSLLLGAGNTLLAKGVYLDGATKDGAGCIFSTQYLRKFFKDKVELVMFRMDQPMDRMNQVDRLLTHDNQVPNVVTQVIIERETVL